MHRPGGASDQIVLDGLDANDIVPDGINPEMVAPLDGVRAAEALCSNLTAKVESLARDLAEAKNELSDAAIRAELDGNEESYRAAETEIERLSHALQRAKTAQPAATQRLLDARRALHVLSRSGLVKTFTRLCGARSKVAGRAPANLTELAAFAADLEKANRRIADAWPGPTRPYFVGGTEFRQCGRSSWSACTRSYASGDTAMASHVSASRRL
jgi:hypothetical protein